VDGEVVDSGCGVIAGDAGYATPVVGLEGLEGVVDGEVGGTGPAVPCRQVERVPISCDQVASLD
jgi:hypothetical protein